jgi:cytochrome c oxidase assembly factor CtaG
MKSDAADRPVRRTDWPGVPSLPPYRLFLPRVGTLRVLAAVSGTLVVALAALGLRDPLASMSSYTAALMALNQIAPPLLLLALPGTVRVGLPGCGKAAALANLLLDPWAATTLFICLSIAVSLPGVFDPSVANALYAAPLGLLELSGLLFWAQFMPATRRIRPAWLAGAVAWIGAMPMTVVAVVWMLSPDVLFTPYLDVICRWNIPPLVDQRWAGLLMFVAGVPVQLVGVWLLLGSSRRIVPATGSPTRHPPKRERASGIGPFRLICTGPDLGSGLERGIGSNPFPGVKSALVKDSLTIAGR